MVLTYVDVWSYNKNKDYIPRKIRTVFYWSKCISEYYPPLERHFRRKIFKIFVNRLQTLPKLTGGLLCYLELHLSRVTFLLLNTIYAQLTGNWKEFLQCIMEFLPYCSSLNCQNYARNLPYCLLYSYGQFGKLISRYV